MKVRVYLKFNLFLNVSHNGWYLNLGLGYLDLLI